jgi:heavy metal sensor kinase
MTARARQITAEHLEERLPVENPNDEFGQLAGVVNNALDRLERAFLTLRRFTADASHELRTPLTAIRSVGEVGLRERRTEAEYREMIGSILEETERLTTMADSLLTLSRADAGKAGLRPARVSLGDLALEVGADLAVLAEEKRQQLDVDVGTDVAVTADRPTLRQAVINLLDNAIKYSPEDAAIRIAVRSSGRDAVLEVIDGGPGIEPEHLPHVFERFYRADRSRSRAGGGAGLGLAIARWAVEANGGRIEVESEVPRGSVFRIVLPAAN